MPRLLYLVNIPRFFVTHRLPLAEAARAAGYDVHVAAAGDDEQNAEIIRTAGFPFHPLPLRQHGVNPLQELRALLACARITRRIRPQVLHALTIKPVLYAGLSAHLRKPPALIFALTGLGYLFSDASRRAIFLRGLISRPLRLALAHPDSRIIFQNPDDQCAFIKRRLVPKERTALIRGSGVDVRRFEPRPEAAGPPQVLFAGRLLWAKGVRDFVSAAQYMREEGVEARFVIAGYPEAGNPATVDAAQLAAWQEEGIVEYRGAVADMPALLAASHIVCLPSRYGEGVPSILLEAAASGRAIVTTDIPGCREIARAGENAALILPGDRPALYEALRRLITDPQLRRDYGARGREIAVAEFSQERVFGETLALYAELLSRNQR